MSNSPDQILEGIYTLLGQVVLLPIPLETKGPTLSGWQHITYNDTQRPEYRRTLIDTIACGGNLGVLQGPASGRLLARDVDDDEYVEQLLVMHPWLANTLRTRGKRGCQFWLRLEPDCQYPNEQAVLNVEHGELRLGGSGGSQSVLWGLHPDGMRYQHNGKPPLEIALADLYDLCPQLGVEDRQEDPPSHAPDRATEQHQPAAGDARLQEEALVAEVTSRCGPPAFFNAKSQMTSINERFWATLLSRENILVHEPDEGEFYHYDKETGLFLPTTDDSIRAQYAERIFRASQDWPGFAQLQRFQGGRILAGAIAHLRGVTESRAFKEPSCHYIHCANCVLEVHDDGFVRREFSPVFKSRNRSPVVYDEKASCPRFEKEVLGILRQEDRDLVQKIFGGMLLGYNIAQKILMLHGIGNTGKTTLALILQGIVGSENISELRTAHLDERFEIGRFLGKSLLIGVDVDADFLNGPAIGRLKGLVGGDFLDAEKKSNNRNFRLHGRFNVLITSNTRLRIKLQGDQSAWRRRLLLVPYERRTLRA